MAIGRVPGAALLPNLDRQGLDLQFTTSGNTLVYMDFANFYVGINEEIPTAPLTVRGDILAVDGNLYTSANLTYNIGSNSNWWNEIYVDHIYSGNINATYFSSDSITGTLTTNAQPNITSLGNLISLAVDGNITTTGTIQTESILPFSNSSGTIGDITLWYESVYANTISSQGIYGTILTQDQYNITNLGNINVESITVGGNISLSGNTSGGIINADELYDSGNRVLTEITNISVTGDATGTGIYSNIAVTLANTGVVADTYGSNVGIAQITLDEKGRATSANTITLNRVGNINVNDTTITTVSGDIIVSSNIANVDVTGTVSATTVITTELYEAGNRALTDNSNLQITGDVVGYGTYSNINVELVDTGVVAGIYGSADDEYADRIPKITVDSKGRITNIANVTLTQVGNVTFIDNTISTLTSNITISPGDGVVDVNNSYIVNLADPVSSQDAVTLSYLQSAISSASPTMSADDTSIILNDDGIDPGYIEITVDGTLVGNVNDTTTTVEDIVFEDDTISATTGNLTLNGLVAFSSNGVMHIPSGLESERPVSAEEGYFRYNTERNSIEFWNGTIWKVPGQAVISSDIITPDGVGNAFVLSQESTNDAVFVSINGTIQQPASAYNISGNVITFAEVPLTTDIIEVRHLTVDSTSVGALRLGSAEVYLTSSNVNVTGHVLPTANVTYDLGSDSLRWRDLYLAGNTIVMGNLTLRDENGVLSVLDSSGFEAPLSAADPVADTDVVTLGYLNSELSGLSSGGLVADDTEIAVNDDGIDPGNVEIIVDGANVALFTETEVTFYANVVAQNITDEINTANVNMRGYVDYGLENLDVVITTANTNMQGYVDNEISSLIDSAPGTLDTLNEIAAALGDDPNLATTITTTISTANINMKGYVDGEITTVSSDISTANVNMRGYVDYGLENLDVVITTANTAMKGYVDSVANLTSYGDSNVASYLSSNSYATETYVDNATELDNLLPSGEQTGYVLKTSGAGTYYWSAESGGGSVVGQELTTLRQSNTATSGQTIFTLVDGKTYTPGSGQLRVYINGVRQFPDAYTETSANVYTLSTGVNAGTIVFAEIDQFSSFNNYANLTYVSNIGNIAAVGLTVQSAIENLETNKATLADPVFTGTPTAPTASSGTNTTQIATTAFVQTANVALKGYTDTQLATKANLANPTFSGNITVSGNVKFTGWHVYEANNTLYFAFGGAVKMSLNTSGNLTVSGDVTGFGTP